MPVKEARQVVVVNADWRQVSWFVSGVYNVFADPRLLPSGPQKRPSDGRAKVVLLPP